ncbi:MAG: alpha-N-arabinofuranosidase [Novosphingobium sp.]
MTWRTVLALAAGLTLGSTPLRAAESEGPVIASLDTAAKGPTISRDIFGQFAEMLGEGIYGGVWVGPDSKIPNVRGIRSDVVGALKALKVPNVRWPGGCYGDQYHWRDGVGPRRQSRINANWGGSAEPNTFGTHEFMDFVEQIGSEAYISVNMGSGTVQEAADWLEYMTAQDSTLGRERAANGRAKPWKLKFVGLGNEMWGCGGGLTADEYVGRMKPFALFLNNYHPEQRPANPFVPNPNRTQRIAAAEGLGKPEYTEAIMKARQGTFQFGWGIEGLSLHNYVAPTTTPLVDSSIDFGEKEYAGLLAKSYSTERMVADHSAIMDKYDPGKQVFMAVDEWGAWLKPLPEKPMMFLRQQNSLRDALSAAIHLNGFARHADRVKMANIAQMVNVIQAMILTDGDKMLLTPTYHVFRMYVPFQDATLVPVAIDAGTYRFGESVVPRVDAVAARARDDSIWLALVNTDPARPVTVTPAGITARRATGDVLTAGAVSAINTFAAPDTVSPRPYVAAAKGGKLSLTLAPKSLTVVRLEP